MVIADDAASLRMLLRMAIARDPRITLVGEAAGGREVVEVARVEQPDVVVLDVTMPHTSAVDILPALLLNAPRARVLVLSGHDEDAVRKEVLASGADRYLVKGTPLREVLETIVELSGTAAR